MPRGVYERTDEYRRQCSERQQGRKVDWLKPCEEGCTCGKHEKSEAHRAKLSEVRMGLRPDMSPAIGSYIDTYGYRILTGKWNHPLVLSNGELKEHRQVLYAKIGPGPHWCYICRKAIYWKSPDRDTELCVDHLDGDKLNNDPINLEPACFKCNWDRGLKRMREAV